jgi:hypothetical protein
MEIVPREQSPYYLMNAALRDKVRSKVRPWRDYIWLLLHAMRMLPPATELMVYRGMKQVASSLPEDYSDGEEFVWSGFSSTASTISVMKTFLGSTGDRTMWQLELTEPVARDIRPFSLLPGENEILLPPNVQFEAVSRFDAGGGLTIIQCKQVESDDPILDFAA